MKQHFTTHAHLWKRTAIISFLLLQATSFVLNGNGFSWSYPLKEVSKDSTCRKTTWENLDDDCKVALPIIKWAQYDNYRSNPLYTTIYTTMRGAPYDNGRAVGMGAHEWVDIVSSEWTPVYAVEDGTVIRAKSQAGYGNVVMIKHTLADKKVVFSIYGHLNEINTTEWVTVKEGDLIGTVWNEGFSFWNHLLFDINITPTNTYAFWGCPDYGNGTTFNVIANIVNQGLCRTYLLERTTDPIAWIESQWNTISLTNSVLLGSAPASSSQNRKRMPMVALPPTIEKPATAAVVASIPKATSSTTIQKSLATSIVAPQDVSQHEVATASNQPIDMTKLWEQFLSNYTVSIVPSFSKNIAIGNTTSLVITITDKNGKPYMGMLPKEITLIPSENIVTLSPQVVRLTNSDGKAIILMSADKVGSTTIIVSYNMKTIGKINANIQ